MGINYRCEERGKQFTCKARLNKHKLIYEGKQYPFSCKQCDYQTTRKYNLNQSVSDRAGYISVNMT